MSRKQAEPVVEEQRTVGAMTTREVIEQVEFTTPQLQWVRSVLLNHADDDAATWLANALAELRAGEIQRQRYGS